MGWDGMWDAMQYGLEHVMHYGWDGICDGHGVEYGMGLNMGS